MLEQRIRVASEALARSLNRRTFLRQTGSAVVSGVAAWRLARFRIKSGARCCSKRERSPSYPQSVARLPAHTATQVAVTLVVAMERIAISTFTMGKCCRARSTTRTTMWVAGPRAAGPAAIAIVEAQLAAAQSILAPPSLWLNRVISDS